MKRLGLKVSGCDADETACRCGRRCPGSIANPGSQKRPSASSDTPTMEQFGTTGLMIAGVIGMVLGIPAAILLGRKTHKGISE